MRKLALILLVFGITSSLYSEIVDVRVSWNNIQCQSSCAELLQKSFKEMKQVSNVSISAADGIATLGWKADAPFNSQAIRFAVGKVGIPIETLSLTVRGTVSHNQKKFYIKSLGDLSTFNLIGTIDPSGSSAQAVNSPFNRPLAESLQKQLLEAEKNQQIVTITGPILNLNQFPPLDLVAERVNISDPKNP